jgi:hypothetical protein
MSDEDVVFSGSVCNAGFTFILEFSGSRGVLTGGGKSYHVTSGSIGLGYGAPFSATETTETTPTNTGVLIFT